MTSRSTLTKGTPANSPLHRISNNSTNVHWDRDERGAYVIDRDPEFFQPVLNYLRYGRLLINRDLPEEAVLLEAEYFNLPKLANEVRARIESRCRQLRYGQGQLMDIVSPLTAHINSANNNTNNKINGLPFNNHLSISGNQQQQNHLFNNNNNSNNSISNSYSNGFCSLTPSLSQSPFLNLENYVSNILDQRLV